MNKRDFLNLLMRNTAKGDPLKGLFKDAKGQFRVDPVHCPPEGGTFTNYTGEKFPFPGFPDQEKVNLVAGAKRLIPMGINMMSSIIGSLRQNEDPHRWCKTSRELYRIFNIMIEREKDEGLKKKFTDLRDAVCLFLEYDDAYRFRFQAAFQNLNIGEIKMTEADRFWASRMDFDFEGKEDSIKKHGKPGDSQK